MSGRSAQDRLRSVHDGAAAERWVADCLVARGWQVLDRNWRGAGGELDLVVLREGRLRFVEVKARGGDDCDGLDAAGLDAVGPGKRRRLIRAARAWIAQRPDGWQEAAFTVALVDLDALGEGALAVRWIDDAFDA